MTDLNGRTALVTGGSRGIGRAIARRLAADGAYVAVHYGSNDTAARETVAAIEADGGHGCAVRAEFGVPGDVDVLFTELAAGLDGRRLDILVNNAGLMGNLGPIAAVTPDAYDRLFTVNVRTPFFVVQRALPMLSDGGRIINISSCVTRMAVETEIAYAMTKSALETMGRMLVNPLGARGITVNSVAAGVTRTEMTAFLDVPEVAASVTGVTAMGRLGEPGDVAGVVAFLASDDARWVTGQVVEATGGMWAGPIMPA